MIPAKKPRRQDGAITREHLLTIAERMFANRGYAGVSLAEIGTAAGRSNKMVIPYYFGSKEGLVDAIFERRIQWLEESRQRKLDASMCKDGLRDLRMLIDILYRPISEIELDGQRVYARFLLQYILQFDSWDGNKHPIETSRAQGTTPTIIAAIDQLLPNLPPRSYVRRCTFLFLGAVVDWENRRMAGLSNEDLSQVVDSSLDFIVAGLVAMNARAEQVRR